jgi:hypothetical protein
MPGLHSRRRDFLMAGCAGRLRAIADRSTLRDLARGPLGANSVARRANASLVETDRNDTSIPV